MITPDDDGCDSTPTHGPTSAAAPAPPANLHVCVDVHPSTLPAVPTGGSGGDHAFNMVDYLAAARSMVWANGKVVRVAFLDGDASVRQKVEFYAHTWEKYANVRFDFGQDQNAEVRISFKGLGSWSRLGKDALNVAFGSPTMNYGWLRHDTADLEYERTVTHEFGHALGFIHEHQNPGGAIPWNKPVAMDWYKRSQGWTEAQVEHNLFRRYEVSSTQFSDFDKKSIMLYPIPPELTTNGFSVGFNQVLSDTDKAFAGMVYPFPATPKATPLFVGAPAANADIGKPDEIDVYTVDVPVAGRYRVETGGTTDVVMALYGPDDDTKLGEDDDGGFFHNARLELDLQPGKYTVRVWHYLPLGTGQYAIWVTAL